MSNKIKKLRAGYFHILNQLQTTILFSYLRRDYLSNKNHYEERLHQLRKKLFGVTLQLRKVASADCLVLMENLYEIIFSLNSLNLRVVDHTTFEVCEKEISVLAQCITEVLQAIELNKNKSNVDNLLNELANAIHLFEAIYRSTLQIVSYEPIVFLFFLQNIMSLHETLGVFSQEFLHV